jgi:DNA phosphorothioation-dependent restriction protein DptG
VSTIQEIEEAISRLSDSDRAKLRDWLANLDQDEWDKQIADDEAAGRLDALADEAFKDLREGRCTEL